MIAASDMLCGRGSAMYLLARSAPGSFGTGRRAGRVQRPRWTPPTATYVICTNPRSGSWLLSDGLASTSLAGNPREWFNPLVEQQKRAQWRLNHSADLTYAQYLNQVHALGRTSNGICGIKLHYYQFDELLKKLATIDTLRGLPTAKVMATAFPNTKYIWLTRRDKERQAVSYQLACTMGQWWIIDGAGRNKGDDGPNEPEFDPRVIARLEETLRANDLKWQAFFRGAGITPLTVYYEDLASDYSGTIVRILNWLDVASADAAAIRPSRFARQSNAQNEDWLARYKAFKASADHPAQSAISVEMSSPLAERSRTPLDVIPDAWKAWIARQRLLMVPDEAIIETLASNGYRREAAVAQLGTGESNLSRPNTVVDRRPGK
jgi:trehalose 2-sulfotransferase